MWRVMFKLLGSQDEALVRKHAADALSVPIDVSEDRCSYVQRHFEFGRAVGKLISKR